MTEGRREEPDEAPDFAEPSPTVARLEPLADAEVGVGRDFTKQSSTMLLVCSASSDALRLPPFAFLAVTSRIPARRLFARDVRQVWYQHGVSSFGDTIEEVAESLRVVQDAVGARRLVAVGHSAGGYAALMLGTLLGAERVVAFTPQAVIERTALAQLGDERWPRTLDRLDELGGPDERYADLRAALARDRRAGTRYDVHYDPAVAPDERHALLLDGVPGLELHTHDFEGSNLIRSLRATGELERILDAAIAV
jgi:pimeloyl-ACP methyl ester carboxylesterase